ncbi:acetoin dehydrogenase E2 subunit dihydrolipoyllysine-residue acetyltransferase [Legionella massiliensis]|uniref:Acetoin dehydrogenase E2 subunit dihydrolipoyllysine-residue acetyltransferase n=1 Tax=Legionella massiliensis TaxID=1034943 RepID=A0A078KWB5_9GAMM|nr:alpha/beta hydrolase [Legionella massiliensis]CDZ76044.1 acetoin dehydrogenase E2 subunit dihydrolipoyllysine-residue acetyltransferase [Legionella massiliensis]CEE11782.1 2-hydroxy-6-oxononadienedioate/2-hydroxy-6-oxononatrienedioate hydrolase [Legionella massiliensis]
MIKAIFTVSCSILIILTLLMYLFQRNLIYFPAREMPSRQVFHAEDMQELWLKTSDGLNLLAWYKPAQANQPTLLFLHGNAGHIGNRMPLIRQFLRAGFGALLLEYRGYGGNKGKPAEESLYSDARAAMHFLQEQTNSSRSVVLYGESLGTGVAVKMASEFPICALVLQSPYTSLSAVARYHYPWIFIPPLDKFDSLARISTIKAPVLILHGKRDQIVPFEQGLELYNQANEPKRLVAPDNKGHNNLWDDDFAKTVIHFIQTYCA